MSGTWPTLVSTHVYSTRVNADLTTYVSTCQHTCAARMTSHCPSLSPMPSSSRCRPCARTRVLRCVLRYVSTCMCRHVCVDTCADMCVNMCVDLCVDMCVDMCVGIWVDMWVDMCVDTCVDTCVDPCGDMCVGSCVGNALKRAPTSVLAYVFETCARRVLDM